MSALNNYFEHIFCINLKRRIDRKLEAEAEFSKHGIKNVEFIEGIDGLTLPQPQVMSMDGSIPSKGDIGCAKSHKKVAELARERGISKYLVLEDDIQFVDKINDGSTFESYMRYVPNDVDVLYYGGNHDGAITMVSHNIFRMSRTYTTHCYSVYTERYRDAIIDALSHDNEKVDVAIATLHSKFNCYVTRPSIAFQRASHSDILNKFVNYEHLKK